MVILQLEHIYCLAAEHLKSLAKELVRLGPKQLQAVSPILEPEVELLEAISTAKGITPTNQVNTSSHGLMDSVDSISVWLSVCVSVWSGSFCVTLLLWSAA